MEAQTIFFASGLLYLLSHFASDFVSKPMPKTYNLRIRTFLSDFSSVVPTESTDLNPLEICRSPLVQKKKTIGTNTDLTGDPIISLPNKRLSTSEDPFVNTKILKSMFPYEKNKQLAKLIEAKPTRKGSIHGSTSPAPRSSINYFKAKNH